MSEVRRIDLRELLARAVERGASDLHLRAACAPKLRISGELVELSETGALTGAEVRQLAQGVMSERQQAEFARTGECDLSFTLAGYARFRANIFIERGEVGAVFRAIPLAVKTLEELNLPTALDELCDLARGLVLVTGPTGSGKSTTLAAMIERINATRPVHILTIEDPIEFVYAPRAGVITQREVGRDTESFAEALRRGLRQDPDVVLVGEMRDLETIRAAVTMAETGHLTFATLHTNSAAQTINRIIDAYPAGEQAQIRTQLSLTLEAVLSQTLVARADGRGRVLAMEIMRPTAAIRNLIREGQIHKIAGELASARGARGMQTLDQALAALYAAGRITAAAARQAAHHPEEFEKEVAAARARGVRW